MGLKAMSEKDLPKAEHVADVEEIPEVKEETITIDMEKGVDDYARELQAELSTRDEHIKTTIMSKLIMSDQRLADLPILMSVILEIMLYRLKGKKSEIGLLKATVNQISCAVEISQEDIDEWDSL